MIVHPPVESPRPAERFPVALVVDDEPHIRRVLLGLLRDDFERVIAVGTGREAVAAAAVERPSLIILDLGLPDLTGLVVCREIRTWSQAAIIVLSARHADAEKVELLDAGADDYVTKPFSPAELGARVRAQVRRVRAHATVAGGLFRIGDLAIDVARRTLSRSGVAVHLTPTEWSLLRVFVKHAGRTVTHRQIFREVWGSAAGDAQAYLRVHVANLRRKIEPEPVRPTVIMTEPGVGYRFADDE